MNAKALVAKALVMTGAAFAALSMSAWSEPAGGAAQGRGRGGGQPVQPIQQVKAGLFVVAGGGANSVVRVTNDGVILVDTKLPGDQNYTDLMAQIRTVTSQPVKFAVVTHHHADHTGNIDRFLAAGAQVIGHENLKKNLVTYQPNAPIAPPSITYDKEYVVRLGGVTVEAHHYGRSHTSGDTSTLFISASAQSRPTAWAGMISPPSIIRFWLSPRASPPRIRPRSSR